MEIMDGRTGWVRVLLKNGNAQTVEAPSFGAAAAQIKCAEGHIVRFEHVSPPTDTDREQDSWMNRNH